MSEIEGADNELEAAEPPQEPITFAEFLENTPPTKMTPVTGMTAWKAAKGVVGGHMTAFVATPELSLHCPSDYCKGTRKFRSTSVVTPQKLHFCFLSYVCQNCRQSTKNFALLLKYVAPDQQEVAYKIGEVPLFGPPTPSRLLRLLGPEKQTFLRGRRCENQGLGVGAFAYYRRVVEVQKSKIIHEIAVAAEKLGSPPETLQLLSQAANEKQFSKALELIKDVLPPVLLLNGHNPMALLYKALSEGLHADSDAECLEIAHDIRVILADLAERIGRALKEDAELKSALTRLLNRPSNAG